MQQNKQDLEYQPKQENYSFVNRKLKLKLRIKTFSLVTGLILIIILPLIAGFFINYFRIYPLSRIYPVFESLPKFPYELSNIINDKIENINENKRIGQINKISDNTFAAQGKISYLTDAKIKVKLPNGKDIDLITTIDSKFYVQHKEGIRSLVFATDIIKKENVGKEVLVQFTKEGLKNKLIEIEIIKNN